MDAVRARWSSWSFLVYAGGLVFALAAGGWFDWLSSQTGAAGDVAWAILILVVLLAIAEVFARGGHPFTAGVFAFGALGAFVLALGQLFDWSGWTTEPALQGFHLGRLLLELLWIAAAAVAIRRYRFPLLVAQLVIASWFFIADLVSGGGTWSAIVSIALGVATLAIAAMLDSMDQRAYAFWVHVGSGLLIGIAALWLVWDSGTIAWALIVVASVAYVSIGSALGRSSWAVLGAAGIFIAAAHYAIAWNHLGLFFVEGGHAHRPWAPPLVFTVAAALVVALGLAVSRRRPVG